MKKYICLALALVMLVCLLSGCAPKEEDKPQMKLSDVIAIADDARNIPITFFSQYEFVVLGSKELPLYYFQLKEIDYAFSVGMDEFGQIESMMLSHSSGNEIYLFHTAPGKLDPSATQYTEDAKSYDIEKFITKMSEE